MLLSFKSYEIFFPYISTGGIVTNSVFFAVFDLFSKTMPPPGKQVSHSEGNRSHN